jgi:hypothetical protein
MSFLLCDCSGNANSGLVCSVRIANSCGFGLSVLDYMITRNHTHLLIKDTGPNVTARSMD